MTLPTDEELMAAYVAGDAAAFDEIFRRYAPVLVRTLRRGAGSDEAGDLLQQTFLQLHRSRADFTPGAALRPWLFTIAINVKRQHWRALSRRRETRLGDDIDQLVEAIEATDQQPVGEEISALLVELPPSQREVIELHFIEGLSFARVAEVVGSSLGAVRVRAHRGYVLLRARFAQKVGPP
jgi:RNA polymerase sigma factor (sigma-70 family)